jgi:hypothetical protein
MPARIFRTRIPAPLAAPLTELCDLMQQSYSGALRACVEYMLDRPELWPELFARHMSTTVEDLRTEAQKAACERDWEHLVSPERLLRTTGR